MTLFLIKLVHTVVFLVESTAILYILYSGLFNVGGRWLILAVTLALLETAVYVGSGLRCPLTGLAVRYGDRTGGNDLIADLFLPSQAAALIPRVCGGLMVIGLGLIGWRLLG
jgi:hypothetical protein